jgi:subtilisin family serine protease
VQPPCVLNFSLGVHVDYANSPYPVHNRIVSLDDLLGLARLQGHVTVAAAGNGSGCVTPPAKPNAMEAPAAVPGVIGVVASNKDGDRACFSNQSQAQAKLEQILAPGGEGVDPGCKPMSQDCNGLGGNCPYGVISLVYDAGHLSYAYWAGTSFATPLVSGLAAGCIHKHAKSQPTNEWTGTAVAVGVWNAISSGAGGSGNVIKVPQTLEACIK